uniref:Cell adhesion molecule 2 n=1 Tax=Lygus hesperus TaxID=30085 RepID=A0A0A9WGX7_LYGHE
MLIIRAFFSFIIVSGTCWRCMCYSRIQELGSPRQKLDGLRHVRVFVPVAVKEGDNAVLMCFFDLNGDSLYSVKWYKGGREMYRYMPREVPSVKVFPITGLSDLFIEKTKSNGTHLFLKKVTINLSGRYSCEVSADAPSFRTALVSGDMNIVVVPSAFPEIKGMKARYKLGDTLEVQCVSKDSRPAANLTWSLNGRVLDSEYVKQANIKRDSEKGLETAVSTLTLSLHHHHFVGGRIKAKCTASIHNIYWQTTENSAGEEKPKDAEPSTSISKDALQPSNVPKEGQKKMTPPIQGATAVIVQATSSSD